MIKQTLYRIGCAIVAAALWGNISSTFAEDVKNVLENGSFEEGEVGPIWDKQWIPGWPTGGSPDVISLVKEPRTDSPGKLSIKIVTTEEIPGGGISSELTPLDPAKPLKVKGWIKEQDPSAGLLPYIGVAWYDGNREPVIVKPETLVVNYVYIMPYNRSSDWQEVEMNVPVYSDGDGDTSSMIPKNAAYFQVRLFVGSYIGTLWFDDFVATQD